MSIPQKGIEGSNPSVSAILSQQEFLFLEGFLPFSWLYAVQSATRRPTPRPMHGHPVADDLTQGNGFCQYAHRVPDEDRTFASRSAIKLSTRIRAVDDPRAVEAKKAAAEINAEMEGRRRNPGDAKASATAATRVARRRARSLGPLPWFRLRHCLEVSAPERRISSYVAERLHLPQPVRLWPPSRTGPSSRICRRPAGFGKGGSRSNTAPSPVLTPSPRGMLPRRLKIYGMPLGRRAQGLAVCLDGLE